MSRIPIRGLIVPALLVVITLGPPLWLDSAAPETDAVVTQKYDGYRLNRDPDGGWRRRLVVFTAFRTPAGVAHTSELMLGDSDYDKLSVGSHLRVRYLPIYPYTTRPVARTTLMQARERLTPETTRARWFMLLLIFGPIIFVAGRLSRVAAFAVAGVWLGATWIYVLAPKPLPVPGPVHTSARVSWTEVVSRTYARRGRAYLRTPYRLVALSFVPPNARDSITVLDAVDSVSLAPKPPDGTLEPIGYQPGAPRTALLLVGTRTFINANRINLVIVALSPIVLGLVVSMYKRRKPVRVTKPSLQPAM